MPAPLTLQARQLYQAFSALVRAYQFRDRDGICCHGISVSQCYALDHLATRGPRTMGELAGDLYLEVSSMTRAVDALVSDGLVDRVEDKRDRRVRRIEITASGRQLLEKIQTDLIREYERVLAEIAPESRPAVIQAVNALLEALQQRHRGSSTETSSACCVTTHPTAPKPGRAARTKSVTKPAPRRSAAKSIRGRSRA